MELRDYGRLVRRHIVLIVVLALVGLLGSTIYDSTATKSYQAQAQDFVAATPKAGDTSSLNTASAFVLQRIASYTQLADSSRVLSPVIKSLGLHDTVSQLAARTTITNPALTVVLDIRVTDSQAARAATTANAVADTLANTIQSIETPANSATSPVQVTVTKRATTPSSPSSPRSSLDLALGFLIGLLLGIAVAIVRTRLDHSVRTAQQLARLTGAAPLALVRRTLSPRGSAVDGSSSARPSAELEAMRLVRSGAVLANGGTVPKRLLVTAADGSVRSVELACNLAVACAASARVCLLEADLRRPRAATFLGLPPSEGLSAVLTGRRPLATALVEDPARGITVLPAGAGALDASALVSGPAMVSLLEDLSQRFDIVVVAAPALLPLPDSRLLARHTDGVVVAVRAGRTTDQQVTDALKALTDSGGKLLGTVLVNVGVSEHFTQARAASYDAAQTASWPPPVSAFDPGSLLSPGRLEGYRPTTEAERVSDGS